MKKVGAILGALVAAQPLYAAQYSFDYEVVPPDARRYAGQPLASFIEINPVPLFDIPNAKLRSLTFELETLIKSNLWFDNSVGNQHTWFLGSGSVDYFYLSSQIGHSYESQIEGLETYDFIIEGLSFAYDYRYHLPLFTQGSYNFNFQARSKQIIRDELSLKAFSNLDDIRLQGYFYHDDVYEDEGRGRVPREYSFLTNMNLRVTYDYAVPEPSTWAMLCFGIGVIGAALRKRSSTLLQACTHI